MSSTNVTTLGIDLEDWLLDIRGGKCKIRDLLYIRINVALLLCRDNAIICKLLDVTGPMRVGAMSSDYLIMR